jgi:hypothetical protein
MYDKTMSYEITPCLITLPPKPAIILDREHADFAWVLRDQLSQYEMLDDLPYAIDGALAAV